MWRIVDRVDTVEDECVGGAATEVYDAEFVDGVERDDYEASDLLYGSDAYARLEEQHFGGMGLPPTLGHWKDLQSLSSASLRFLWSAAFITVQSTQ